MTASIAIGVSDKVEKLLDKPYDLQNLKYFWPSTVEKINRSVPTTALGVFILLSLCCGPYVYKKAQLHPSVSHHVTVML